MGGHYKRKRDSNHNPIVRQWKAIPGCHWQDTDRQGDGCPDGVACTRHRGTGIWHNLWVEFKQPGQKADLTPKEAAFLREWPGPYIIADSLEDIMRWFGMVD